MLNTLAMCVLFSSFSFTGILKLVKYDHVKEVLFRSTVVIDVHIRYIDLIYESAAFYVKIKY